MATTVSSVVSKFTRSHRIKGLGELLRLTYKLQFSCIHTTNAVLRGKKKVKVPRVSKLAQMREAGKTEEEIQAFIDGIVAKKTATQAYLAKIENVAEAFRNEFRIEEEKMKSVEGEQMKKEQEEREMQARNMAFLLKNNEDLSRERELRNLINAEKKQKEEEEKALQKMEKDRILFEKRRALVLQAVEESKHFVTKENLEEKIEYALENESNYNFAITPDGDKLYSTKPPGNFTDIGWRGTSPAAFLMGGISLGENDFLFEKRYASTVENQNDEEQVDSENIETTKSRPLE